MPRPFIFKHALVQDAAHSSLLRSSQQQLHAQIAEALETHLGADSLSVYVMAFQNSVLPGDFRVNPARREWPLVIGLPQFIFGKVGHAVKLPSQV